jgi:hypothetical protein
VQKDYQALREGLGRRPSLSEFYRFGASLREMRQQFGSWFSLVEAMGDLTDAEREVLSAQQALMVEVEVRKIDDSLAMILLEAFQELDGWRVAPSLSALAERSWQTLQRRRALQADLPAALRQGSSGVDAAWQRHWLDNPVAVWTGDQRKPGERVFFRINGETLRPTRVVAETHRETFAEWLQELVDYRLAAYVVPEESGNPPVQIDRPGTELPFFPNLKIACGHFKTGTADCEEYRFLGEGHGRLDPARHFIARASGNSMNGGKQPIQDGDYLLLEQISPSSAGAITGSIMAIERQDGAGDNQYLLRVILKARDGSYVLRANNPDYADIAVTDELQEQLRTFARLRAVLDPREMAVGQRLMREEIPPLFGVEFNPGNWNVGHVVLPDAKAHVLLVTLNKKGKEKDHRYLDHWIDEHTFHWQSQKSTTPQNKRGREIIKHEKLGLSIHLFIREDGKQAGKAVPFIYHGPVRYRSHSGSKPMSVVFELLA